MADALDIPGLIRDTAIQYGVPPDFALSIAQQESGLNPGAVSPKGAVGVFQLMPDTAKGLGVDPRDAKQNIDGGVRYIKQQLDAFGGNRQLAAAAFNAGPEAVAEHGGVPPYKETQAYVKSVAGGDENLPDPQAVLKAYGFDNGQVGVKELPNVPGYVSDPSYKPPAGEESNPAWQAPAVALGGLPSAQDIAKAYNWRLPTAPTDNGGSDNGVGAYFKSTIFDAPGRAWDQFKADLAQAYAAKQAQLGAGAPGPMGALRQTGQDLATTARLAGDAAAIPGSLISGPVNAFLTKPLGAAFAAVPATMYKPGTFQQVPDNQRQAVGEQVAGQALSALPGGEAQAAEAATQVAPKANALAEKVQLFDKAGVRPTLAAVGGKGTATAAQVAASNAVAGVRTRANLAASMADTANAAGKIAEGYGSASSTATTGEAAQAAIKSYTQGSGANLPPDLARQLSSRTISFGDKSNALYTRAERLIGDQQTIAVPNTTQAIQNVMGTFDSPALAQRFRNTVLEGIGRDLASTGGQISWRDAKNLRTSIRERLMGDPQLSGTVNDAQVGSIYKALTQDMRDGAASLGGAQAARAWDQANTFYRAGQDQIQNRLTKVFDAPSGEAAYDRILTSAGSKSNADIKRLLAAKRAIGDGWGDVAATAAQRLGFDETGKFSVARFVTNYGKLSEAGKNALFGSLGGGGEKATQLKAALDDLSQVAEMQKGIEQAANHSNTFTHGQTGIMGAAAYELLKHPHPAAVASAAGALGGIALTGEAMTNPTVVRWLAGLGKAKTPEAFSKATAALQAAAKRNRALVPLASQVGALRGSIASVGAAPIAAQEPSDQPQSPSP